MKYYIELLAHVLIDADFLNNCHRTPDTGSGSNSSGGGGNSRQEKLRREQVVQAANYLSASRQIENLICTARESWLGSGAWNKEFYSELQARPFYNSKRVMLCRNTSGGGCSFSPLVASLLCGRNG